MMRLTWCVVLFLCGCGPRAAGNSPYRGSWPSFVVNGSQNLGGFTVDSNGEFQLSLPGIQVNGSIGNDASLTGVVQGPSGGVCTMQGRCTSTEICSGTTVGGGCPADSAGRPWGTVALCRGQGC